jgi:tetratricopeptide (TPR) repeat protein
MPMKKKICAGILSRTSYSVDSLDLRDIENTFNNKYKKSDYINYVLARVYFVKKDDKKALRYINKAISQNPNNYLYRILKANILASKQNYNAAVNELSTLLERNINDRELAYGIKLHKYYMLSLKSKSPAEKNYNLARFYLMSSHEERAKQLILKNIETRKSLSDYNLLARVYFNSSDFANATQTYEKALTIKGKDITATEGLGNIAYIQHNYKQACEQYEKALSYNKKSDKLLLKIANCKRDMSDDKQALELYYQVLNMDPENFFAMYNISQINKNDTESKAIYKKILSINPNFAPAWLGLTRAALIEKNTFLARQYLLNMSHINNSNPVYYYIQD